MSTTEHDATADEHQDGQDDERPVLELIKPQCPRCDGIRFTSGGTIPNGDGTFTKYGQCQECFLKVFILIQYGS
jgi:hypothetical protein